MLCRSACFFSGGFRWQKCQPIQLPRGAAVHRHTRRDQVHRRQMNHPRQRLNISQIELELIKAQQLLRRLVQHTHLTGLHRATELDGGLGRLLKHHFEVGIQTRRRQLERQTGRGIAQVWRQVQIIQFERSLRLARRFKRRGLRAGLKSAAIQQKSQLRLHQHRSLRRQVAQKRQLKLQIAQRVRFADRQIGEIKRAA